MPPPSSRARHNATATRERLARLMGLWGEDLAFQLPDRLPDLPKAPREGGDLEAQAMAQRLDVQGARREAESVAGSLGLTKVTRFVNLLEFGIQDKKETGEDKWRGWSSSLAFPSSTSAVRGSRAERLYMQAVNRTLETAVEARSEVRETYSAYRTAFDLARHYRDEIVPLARISEEVLLRYNGMLMSVFELLADSREQVTAVNAAIETLRDFWIAEADMQMALTGRSPGAAPLLRAARPARPRRWEDIEMNARRRFLAGSAAGFFGAAMVSRVGAASLPEAPIRENAEMAPPLFPKTGPQYNPVVTLNGWSLPWRMNNGWKEFHLVAEPVRRQLAPGMTANLWGYNGQSPGPTIECVEGDRVRIFVTNRLRARRSIGTEFSCRTAWTASAASRSRISRSARPSSTSSR